MEEIKKEEGLKLNKGQVILVGCGLVFTAVVGYSLGERHAGRCFSRGLQRVCSVDPTLKDHMWEAIFKYAKEHDK